MLYDLFLYKFGPNIFPWGISSCLLLFWGQLLVFFIIFISIFMWSFSLTMSFCLSICLSAWFSLQDWFEIVLLFSGGGAWHQLLHSLHNRPLLTGTHIYSILCYVLFVKYYRPSPPPSVSWIRFVNYRIQIQLFSDFSSSIKHIILKIMVFWWLFISFLYMYKYMYLFGLLELGQKRLLVECLA